MRRAALALTVTALMVVLMASSAAPAFAGTLGPLPSKLCHFFFSGGAAGQCTSFFARFFGLF